MGNESRDSVRQDLPGGASVTVEALLTGGDPRSLRNAGIVIDAASRQPERLAELVQCVFSDDQIVRMRASDALERAPAPAGF
jgi:AAA+ superfamily predicted ATPase